MVGWALAPVGNGLDRSAIQCAPVGNGLDRSAASPVPASPGDRLRPFREKNGAAFPRDPRLSLFLNYIMIPKPPQPRAQTVRHCRDIISKITSIFRPKNAPCFCEKRKFPHFAPGNPRPPPFSPVPARAGASFRADIESAPTDWCMDWDVYRRAGACPRRDFL